MESAREIFRSVLDAYQDPTVWTQGAGARDEQGDPVDPLDERAVKFCGCGILMFIVGEPAPGKPPRISWLMDKLNAVARSMGWRTFLRLNDLGTFQDVCQCYSTALQIEEEETVASRPDGVFRAEIATGVRRGEADAIAAASWVGVPEPALA
jgi:hypothetical protein